MNNLGKLSPEKLDALKDYMAANGISKVQLTYELKLTHPTVSKALKGEIVTEQTVQRFVRYMDEHGIRETVAVQGSPALGSMHVKWGDDDLD